MREVSTALVGASHLVRIAATWSLTVCSEMASARAMLRESAPVARWPNTSRRSATVLASMVTATSMLVDHRPPTVLEVLEDTVLS